MYGLIFEFKIYDAIKEHRVKEIKGVNLKYP